MAPPVEPPDSGIELWQVHYGIVTRGFIFLLIFGPYKRNSWILKMWLRINLVDEYLYGSCISFSVLTHWPRSEEPWNSRLWTDMLTSRCLHETITLSTSAVEQNGSLSEWMKRDGAFTGAWWNMCSARSISLPAVVRFMKILTTCLILDWPKACLNKASEIPAAAMARNTGLSNIWPMTRLEIAP